MSAKTWSAAESVGGLIAAGAIFVGALELVYRPFRLAPAALVVALVAAVMSREQQRLGVIAGAGGGVCSVCGGKEPRAAGARDDRGRRDRDLLRGRSRDRRDAAPAALLGRRETGSRG